MYHVDVTLPPISAESLASYRRKLESMAATRLRRIRRAIVVAAVTAAGAGIASAAIPAEGVVAVSLAMLILGMLGFLIPTVVALQAVTSGTVGRNPSAVPLFAMAFAWLAGAAAWIHELAPDLEGAVVLAIVSLAIMQACWMIGGGAGRRLLGPNLELARLQPIENAKLHELACITKGAPGAYLASVSGQGRRPVAMEYDALLASCASAGCGSSARCPQARLAA